MGIIVVHAGMPKAGSSLVQAWLADHSAALLRDHDIGVVVATSREGGGQGTHPSRSLHLAPHVSGPVVSPGLVRLYYDPECDHKALAAALARQLSGMASRHRVVVLTHEALSRIFFAADRTFLTALDELARNHEVRVAYYVRPQHTWLESAWRQWGFRMDIAPSRYVEVRGQESHYFETYERTRALAPRLRFEPRPFRNDLLDSEDVIVDFAVRYLDLPVMDVPEARADTWSNPGLPLDIVNALRGAPLGTIWGSRHDNRLLNRVKLLLDELDIRESDAVMESKRILHQYAYVTFEPENQRLIEAMKWRTESFIPPPEGRTAPEDADISRLDELWRSSASDAELKLLWRLLAG